MNVRHNALRTTPELKSWLANELVNDHHKISNDTYDRITEVIIRAYDNGASDMAALAYQALNSVEQALNSVEDDL